MREKKRTGIFFSNRNKMNNVILIAAALLSLARGQSHFETRRRPLLTRIQSRLGGLDEDPKSITAQNPPPTINLTDFIPQVVVAQSKGAGVTPRTQTQSPIINLTDFIPQTKGATKSVGVIPRIQSPIINLTGFIPQVVVPQGIHVGFRGRTPVEEEYLIEEEWITFQAQFNKVYPTNEDARRRREIFIENRKKVTRHNRDYAFGRTTFFLKLNPLADLLTHEFDSLLNGYGKSRRGGGAARDTADAPRASSFLRPANIPALPRTVDWRQEGAVTSVKTQLQCAGCFAFSAAGAIEGHHYRKTGMLVDLSPQNLIDCTNTDDYSNQGCGGGYVDDCFKYVKDNPGINKEPVYPFEAETGHCRFDQNDAGANVTGFVAIPENDELALAMAVATQGPVSAAIDADHDTFQFYSEGIYFDPNCKNNADNVNHAVLVVGYGEEVDNRRYWLVKNSYGPDWGLGGYIKIAKDVNNHCGIASSAFYPLV